MSRTAHLEVTRSLCADWLAGMGATAEQVETVTDDVAARLADLPSILRLGARTAGLAVAWLPRGVLNLPVASEYRRLIHSLTAVSYFDVISRNTPGVPAQRSRATTHEAALHEKLA